MIDYKSPDGTTFANKPDIGEGLFQVQECAFIEGRYGGVTHSWITVKRFKTLTKAEEWSKVTPTNWTVRQIYVDPKELNRVQTTG